MATNADDSQPLRLRRFEGSQDDQYETLKSVLGVGVSIVTLVRSRVDGKIKACKIIKIRKNSNIDRQTERISHELSTSFFFGKYMPGCIEWDPEIVSNAKGDEIRFYMMHCNMGSLADLIEHRRRTLDYVNEFYVLKVFNRTAGILHHCYRFGHVHRDLKPGNILLHKRSTQVSGLYDIGQLMKGQLFDDIDIYVADWGSCRVYEQLETNSVVVSNTANHGTPGFVAPEITGQNPPYSDKSDVYALGYTIYCLCELVESLATTSTTSRMTGSVETASPTGSTEDKWTQDYSPELRHLIDRCTNDEPGPRPTWSEIFEETQNMVRTMAPKAITAIKEYLGNS